MCNVTQVTSPAACLSRLSVFVAASLRDLYYKSSAVAEMGDRLATMEQGPKSVGAAVPPFYGAGS